MERRLAAILAADIEGYSRLMGADEVGTLRDLTQRRAILDGLIATHRGRIANTAGDSVLAEFGSAVDAVQCAVEAQAALAGANADLSLDRQINFRIGIHVGDVMIKGGDLFGDGVNIAARLQTLASAGGTCISGAAHDQVRKILPFAFADLGAQQVKNIEEPVRAFAVSTKGGSAIAGYSVASVPLALPDKPSIAVLPFQNMSGDPEQEYFADGMVEDIITALSRKRLLFVIARNSSFTYKGKAIDIKQVGRELGVRYVLEGSVRKAGERVRITGQLIDAATGAHLWADKFDGALKDIFDLQDQITASVVGAIAPHLDLAEMDRAKRKPTESLQSYDYYLRGLAYHLQFTRAASDAALPLFGKAIELDPGFALAYAGLASLFVQRKAWLWSDDPVADEIRAVGSARQALQLSKDDALVLSNSGSALMFCTGETDEAVAHFQKAIGLDPNLASAWFWAGWARTILGEHQAAIEHYHRALRLSPLDPRVYNAQSGLAYSNFFLGRYDEALNWATAALQQQPDFIAHLRIAVACHALTGRSEEARKLWTHAREIAPTDRISEIRKRMPYRRDEDVARLEKAYRIAGMPE